MIRWSLRFVPTPVIAICLIVALSLPDAVQAVQSAPLQGKAPAPAKPPAVVSPAPDLPQDDPWEERKTRAREDVEYLEALYKAKQAECREAELRNTFALALKADMDRQKQRGYTSTYTIHQGEMSVAENQAQLEMRRVELKDVEIRLARSRRRLKAVERSAATFEPEAPQADDRLRELEIKYERLRREFELVKRTVEPTKSRP